MDNILKNKTILLGITGSIAAYKAPLIVRELVKEGATVHCVLTPSATEFVSPMVLSNLSRNPVAIDMFDKSNQQSGAWHIHLTHKCDAMLIAPCSGATLGKIANGIYDNSLVTLAAALPKGKPLIIAPAMDTDMLMNPATQRNIATLINDGAIIIPPEEGELSSGLRGPGRLPEIGVLLDSLKKILSSRGDQTRMNFESKSSANEQVKNENKHNNKNLENDANNSKEEGPSYEERLKEALNKVIPGLQETIEKDKWEAEMSLEELKRKRSGKDNYPLYNKKVIITAGPTYEKIDDVRFIGNYSSGKMGFALAKAARDMGASVVLIAGPVQLQEPSGVQRIDVHSAKDMFEAVSLYFDNADILIMSAAVADYTPSEIHEGKIKKDQSGNELNINLTTTNDILGEMGRRKKEGQIVIGFALESENELEYGRKKLQKKNADMIVINAANKPDSGFSGDNNTITIIARTGYEESFPAMSKENCAYLIINKVKELFLKGHESK